MAMYENKIYDWENCQPQNKKNNKPNLSKSSTVTSMLQFTDNDVIRTLFAQCTQPKYRDLSTNNMRRHCN